MKRALITLISIYATLVWSTTVWATACIDWPRVMSYIAIAHQTQKPIIVVTSFANFTKQTDDEWLTYAYRDFVGSLLATAESARVRFGPTATYDPAASQPDYLVGGSFQHTPDQLRIFIEVKKASDGSVVKVIQVDSSYPNNAEFFLRTASAVREVGNAIGISFTTRDFENIRDATDSTQAFEYYHKGMKELQTYNPARFETAKELFTKAKTADFRSWLGYQGLIDLYTFQGLKAKQEGQPFQTFYQIAAQELGQMQRLAKRPPAVARLDKAKPQKKSTGEIKLTNRFLKGNAEFLGGVAALRAGDAKRAEEKLREATKQVPEDALAWQELSNALIRLGKQEEAAQARANGRKVNSCL